LKRFSLSSCRVVAWFPSFAVEKNAWKLAISHSSRGLQPLSRQEQAGQAFSRLTPG
jgi:hypothetical protein